MSSHIPSEPGETTRKKLTGLRMFLIFLAVLVVLVVVGYSFLDLGQPPNP
jgi:hypothetical protein